MRVLPQVLKRFSANRVFLIATSSFFKNAAMQKNLSLFFDKINVTVFSDFPSVPVTQTVANAIEGFMLSKASCIVAIGGGTAIDIAKLVSFFSSDPNALYAKTENNFAQVANFIPIVAIPTTSGSGSEATSFAVLYKDGIKYSVEHVNLIPKYVILDPELTYSMPKKLTAVTGLDALCQAIESYWSIASSDESKSIAAEAICLISNNIIEATNSPNSINRRNMLYAANLAGQAISMTKTTSCHAFSYPMTAHFNIPHGHAVALTLALMLSYNSEVHKHRILDPRGHDYVSQTILEICSLLDTKSVNEAKTKIEHMIGALGLTQKLSLLGVQSELQIETIVKEGFNQDRIKNNPLEITQEDSKTILKSIF